MNIDDMSLEELRTEIAKRRGIPEPQASNWHGVPDYPRSWQAAGELLEEMPTEFKPVIERAVGVSAWMTTIWLKYNEHVYASGDSGPESISRAWLKWKESTNAK